MFKKLVSKTLLSMVMDKPAREKFEAVQEAKRARKSARKNKPSIAESATDSPPAPTAARQPSAVLATERARKTAPPAPTPSVSEADDTASLVRQALDTAEKELVVRKTRRPVSGDRQALIDEAMSIRRSQAKVLDDLDPAQREKLMVMALKTFGGDAEG